MRQTVLLLNTCISNLLGVEVDRLYQKFGEDMRLVGSYPQSPNQHAENLHVTHADAVYIPKSIVTSWPKAKLEAIFAGFVDTVSHYAYEPVDDALGALAQIVKGPSGLVYQRIDT